MYKKYIKSKNFIFDPKFRFTQYRVRVSTRLWKVNYLGCIGDYVLIQVGVDCPGAPLLIEIYPIISLASQHAH